jgi:hypothetical protein
MGASPRLRRRSSVRARALGSAPHPARRRTFYNHSGDGERTRGRHRHARPRRAAETRGPPRRHGPRRGDPGCAVAERARRPRRGASVAQGGRPNTRGTQREMGRRTRGPRCGGTASPTWSRWSRSGCRRLSPETTTTDSQLSEGRGSRVFLPCPSRSPTQAQLRLGDARVRLPGTRRGEKRGECLRGVRRWSWMLLLRAGAPVRDAGL